MSKPRLTPAQTAEVDACCRQMGSHVSLGTYNRILDLLDENAALRARAEQAERDRDVLARERNVLRQLLDEAQPAWGITARKELLDAVDAAYDTTIASGALDRAKGVGEMRVTERCPVCGSVNDADKEHDCGGASGGAASAEGGGQ